MTPEDQPAEDQPAEDQPAEKQPEPEWVRRRRLAAVFGDVIPEQTGDDQPAPSGPPGGAGKDGAGKGDDWYRDQVPPHHG